MGAMIRQVDWTAHPLGAPDVWPQPLKTLVAVMLGSSQPMFVCWGEGRILLYNDGYAEVLAGKHPAALGRDFLDVWSEIRGDLSGIVERAYAGEPVQMDDIELRMERRGYPEETHFAFSYTPVRDEDGAVAGFFCPCVEITEQVLAERRRAADAERQRRLFEQAPGFITVLNGPDHVFEFANAAYRRVFGDRDYAGRAVREVFPELVGQAFFDLLDRVYDGAERFVASRVPIRLCEQGQWTERFLDFIYEPVIDERGQVTGIFVEGHDVTPAVRADAALRESEARFRQMADAVPQIVWITDPDGRVEFFNKQWSDYTGVPYEPTNAAAIAAAFVHPADAEETMLAFGRARATGEPFLVEHRIRSAAGSYRWFLVRAEPYHDPATGAITRWFGASIDIHDRRLAEAAQRDSEGQLRQLNDTLEQEVAARTAERDRMWETSPDLLLVIDFDGVFRRVNPAWRTILGYEPGELVGRHVNNFVVADDHRETVDAYEAAAKGDRPAIENRYRHKDGSIRVISWVAAPAGDVTYATGRDVTGERERAAALAAAQEQLRQAQKMEAVGQLTGGIAHDFNNLLTGVIGSLDMIQRRVARGETDRVEHHAATAMAAAHRAAALTHRLLAFSRRQPLDPKPVDANRLVSGMEELLRRTIGEAISLEMVAATGLWQTLCDPHQLESAILNLAINARDAMPDGGRLTIETCNAHLDDAFASRQRDVRPGHYVCVCVSDTGSGMSKATIDRAFEPFFTTKPIGQGTGLGLSMIYGFARQSEGYARIYSEEGLGTTVKLYLPRHRGAVDRVEEAPAAPIDIGRSGAGEVVLVVEDEAAVRGLVVDVLEDLGYRAIEAADGPAGLRLIESDRHIDLLVTDIGLPGMNGSQLAGAARRVRPGLRILFMTGYAENATIANGFLEPGMQMITKPFALDAIAARIRDMIEG